MTLSTALRIAFVEFEEAADAQRALRECSGRIAGCAQSCACGWHVTIAQSSQLGMAKDKDI